MSSIDSLHALQKLAFKVSPLSPVTRYSEKAEQKSEKSSDDKVTVKKSRKTPQIKQGWVRKEDGQVICYTFV